MEWGGVADVEFQVGKRTVYTGATREFELTVGKRKANAVSAEGWKVLSEAEDRARGSVSQLLWIELQSAGVISLVAPAFG